ncbi:hypothetical protein B0H67DRAFT_647044 [Lasiosphaeris hirsuta]|uniref:Uncharacterized protein n=1 Tax=Lasiosphaeris hirsuta TaxID=260670 RepID=A0AA40DQE0_9PEZI|nr:hypothetical protein B0H67DRAFT_647044 [Lasiosphaeris hirsuta]
MDRLMPCATNAHHPIILIAAGNHLFYPTRLPHQAPLPNMSTLEELDDLDRRESDNKKDKKDRKDDGKDSKGGDSDADIKDAEPEEDDVLYEEILSLDTQDILTRKRLLENDFKNHEERGPAIIT